MSAVPLVALIASAPAFSYSWRCALVGLMKGQCVIMVSMPRPRSSSTMPCGFGQHSGLSAMSPSAGQWNQSITIIEMGMSRAM